MARSALLLVALAACGGGSKQTATTPAPAQPAAETTASRVDVLAPTACSPGSTCEATLVVHALGDFKVNADYPTKFVVEQGSAPIEGTGEFSPADKLGRLTLRFTASQPGPTKIAGTFKYSVCTEDVCNIEEPKIAFEVP